MCVYECVCECVCMCVYVCVRLYVCVAWGVAIWMDKWNACVLVKLFFRVN